MYKKRNYPNTTYTRTFQKMTVSLLSLQAWHWPPCSLWWVLWWSVHCGLWPKITKSWNTWSPKSLGLDQLPWVIGEKAWKMNVNKNRFLGKIMSWSVANGSDTPSCSSQRIVIVYSTDVSCTLFTCNCIWVCSVFEHLYTKSQIGSGAINGGSVFSFHTS